ncbi:MAG: hypothetical protein SFV17_26250 [Candidatus Obscuribacter sp.]|nr:hypothetical protein [Candidatus Obscuribacter sp.]
MKLTRRFYLYFSLTICLVLLIAPLDYWLKHPLLTYADQALYLQCARLILEGQVPYRDFFEWNPPLIMYLSIVPVVLAQLLKLPIILCFNLCVLSLSALSAALSLFLLNRFLTIRVFVSMVPVVLAAVYYSCRELYSFGEREHLFMLAYLPFFIWRMLRHQGKHLAALEGYLPLPLGVWTGLMLCLKPQFVMCAAACELIFLMGKKKSTLIKRMKDPEILVFLSIAGLYLLSLLITPGGAAQTLFMKILPMHGQGYDFSRRALIYMLRGDNFMATATYTILAGSALSFLFGRYSLYISALGAFLSIGLFNYIYGGQAWIYRLVPAEFAAFLIVAGGVGLLLRLAILKKKQIQTISLLALTLLMGLALYLTQGAMAATRLTLATSEPFDLTRVGYNGSCPRGDFEGLFYAIVDNTSPGDRVAFLGTGISPGFPAILQANRNSGAHYLFSILAQIQHCRNLYGEEKWQPMLDKLIEKHGLDVQKFSPKLIAIQAIHLNAILKRANFFERYMPNYKMIGTVDGNDLYLRVGVGGRNLSPQAWKALHKEVVLNILGEKSTVKDESKRTGLDEELINRWMAEANELLSK